MDGRGAAGAPYGARSGSGCARAYLSIGPQRGAIERARASRNARSRLRRIEPSDSAPPALVALDRRTRCEPDRCEVVGARENGRARAAVERPSPAPAVAHDAAVESGASGLGPSRGGDVSLSSGSPCSSSVLTSCFSRRSDSDPTPPSGLRGAWGAGGSSRQRRRTAISTRQRARRSRRATGRSRAFFTGS